MIKKKREKNALTAKGTDNAANKTKIKYTY